MSQRRRNRLHDNSRFLGDAVEKSLLSLNRWWQGCRFDNSRCQWHCRIASTFNSISLAPYHNPGCWQDVAGSRGSRRRWYFRVASRGYPGHVLGPLEGWPSQKSRKWGGLLESRQESHALKDKKWPDCIGAFLLWILREVMSVTESKHFVWDYWGQSQMYPNFLLCILCILGVTDFNIPSVNTGGSYWCTSS